MDVLKTQLETPILYAGEDCDIYLKLEEVGSIELLAETLYYYRINPDRASLLLTDEAAFEMWRRLADKTISRIGLPLRRTNDRLPFEYERLTRPEASLATVDFVIVVAPEPGASLASKRSKDSLRRCGVSDDAMHVVVRDGPAYLNAGFRQTTQPLVCFLDAGIDVEDPARLAALPETLDRYEADLVSPRLETEDGFILFGNGGFSADGRPEKAADGEWNQGQCDEVAAASRLPEKFLLVRREVVQAVGGVDEGYQHDRTALVDFCLKARQRDFACLFLGAIGFVHRGPDPVLDLEADFDRLREKWLAFPDLMAPGESQQHAEESH